jgi:hypothetical protein
VTERFSRYELSKPVSVGLLACIDGSVVESERVAPENVAYVFVRGADVRICVSPAAIRSNADVIDLLCVYRSGPAGCQCGQCEEGPNMLVIRCAGAAAQRTEAVAE